MFDNLEIRMRLYHAVPGRVRLKIPELRRSHGLRSALKNRLEDVLAARLSKLGLFATVLTLLLTRSFSRSFSVMLVMACPCATVLAASTAIAAAISNAARHQILIKGGAHLEQIPSIDVICFDKTGTLTTDEPRVTSVIPRVPQQNLDRIVQMGAGAEIHATHPMAGALIREARRRNLELRPPDRTEVSL